MLQADLQAYTIPQLGVAQRQEITALTAEVQSIIIAANARVASPDSIARMSILCVSFQLFDSHECLDSFNDRHMSFTLSLTLTHSLDWSVGYDQDFDKSTLEPGNWSTKRSGLRLKPTNAYCDISASWVRSRSDITLSVTVWWL